MPEAQAQVEPEGSPTRRLAVPLLIAGGAFVGANLRHLLALGLPTPGGTLAANVLGCVLLGGLLSLATARVSRAVRLLVGTGLCSSLTTYSTFALEAATAPPGPALLYVLATYGLGFAGVVVGIAGARSLARHGPGGGA